jgi:hypothetical protein
MHYSNSSLSYTNIFFRRGNACVAPTNDERPVWGDPFDNPVQSEAQCGDVHESHCPKLRMGIPAHSTSLRVTPSAFSSPPAPLHLERGEGMPVTPHCATLVRDY